MKRIIIAISLLCALALAETYEIGNRSDLNRIDVDTNGEQSVMPRSIFTNCVLWPTFSYNETNFWDLSTSLNNGLSPTAGALPPYTNAYGGARVFGGVDDVITVPDSASLHITEGITLSAWILTSNQGFLRIISKYNHNANTNRTWEIFKDDSGFIRMIANASITGGADTVTGSIVTDDGAWHFVAGTKGGSTISIYVDGVLDNAAVMTAGPGINTNELPVQIGRYGGAAVSFFDGPLDDPRIYNRALTSNELYNVYISEPTSANGGKR